MTVIIANDTPPAIRGHLKRWFVEPKPNVFVGSINRRTRSKTLEFIRRNAPGLGMVVIADQRNAQGFYVEYYGDTPRRPMSRSGLQVILESWTDPDGEEDAVE